MKIDIELQEALKQLSGNAAYKMVVAKLKANKEAKYDAAVMGTKQTKVAKGMAKEANLIWKALGI